MPLSDPAKFTPFVKLGAPEPALSVIFVILSISLMMHFLFYAAEVAGASTAVAKSPQSVALAAVCIVI